MQYNLSFIILLLLLALSGKELLAKKNTNYKNKLSLVFTKTLKKSDYRSQDQFNSAELSYLLENKKTSRKFALSSRVVNSKKELDQLYLSVRLFKLRELNFGTDFGKIALRKKNDISNRSQKTMASILESRNLRGMTIPETEYGLRLYLKSNNDFYMATQASLSEVRSGGNLAFYKKRIGLISNSRFFENHSLVLKYDFYADISSKTHHEGMTDYERDFSSYNVLAELSADCGKLEISAGSLYSQFYFLRKYLAHKLEIKADIDDYLDLYYGLAAYEKDDKDIYTWEHINRLGIIVNIKQLKIETSVLYQYETRKRGFFGADFKLGYFVTF